MNTLMSVIIDRECHRAEQVSDGMKAIGEAIAAPVRPLLSLTAHEERMKREGEIRALMRRKRGLQAEINDVNDRIALLEAQP